MIAMYRTHLEEYAEKFAEFFKFRRENGILEVRFHSDGGEFKWSLECHKAIIPAMADINNDPDNECVIVTGTGGAFLAQIDEDSWVRHGHLEAFTSYHGYDIFYLDQTREALAMLELKIPVISAINGPSILHGELVLCNDIIVCSDSTYFSDGHWEGLGIVPGDGCQTLWRELLGQNRGRYFLLTGQRIHAEEALELGIVGEVVPSAQLLERAWEIAERVFMSKNRIQRRLTRSLLIQPWRELFVKELGSGLAHEALACFDYFPMNRGWTERMLEEQAAKRK